MFSMSPSILAFDFISFKGLYFGFFGTKIGFFEDWDPVQIDQVQIVSGSTHIVQQLLIFVSFNSDI